MKQIEEWLESEQDYAEGVALYDVHGRSRVVRQLLASGETDFTRARLVRELQALVSTVLCDGYVISVPEKPAQIGKKADSLCDGHVITAPVPVDPQRRDWFAERNHLHAQLGVVATDEERRVMALRILALSDLIQQSYAADKADKPDAQPGHKWATLTDVGEIRRLLANLRPQRSKLKKRPDRAADLASIEADIHVLETKLKP
ncbi:hypothetical protein JAO73_10500 [Hymenobacter sp. BT523]|uniref:hypothetical protein n=1 Tax=Hymenobacter sp. BT523 TaxID=2795725 RepID=UPI0018EB7305|nr:hypothetical protein [Hymenobacter sp. BT523]MBJ6109445.1 hypothetical protein [Hymenobacter sp. BT523]